METYYTNLNLMSKKHYKIKYFINVDVLAEEIVEASEIDAENLKLKQREFPSKTAKWVVYNDMKVRRKTIEDYDEKFIDSNKK